MNKLYYNILQNVNGIKELKHSRILVTGATGLIGREIIRLLSEWNEQFGYGICLILVARSEKKLGEIANRYRKKIAITIKVFDIVDFKHIDDDVDYIIHCASITDSRTMLEKPVEVIKTNVLGTGNILQIAKQKKVKSMIYLSSMEIYGFSETEKLLSENDILPLNPIEVRNCYPESKRMCENLCVAYFKENGVPVKIIRLAQTFGNGVSKNDKRVFAEFGRCLVNRQDIVLKTAGNSKRMYLDTNDAVSAILTILLNGANGEAYNAANKTTYCSIKEMAQRVVEYFCREEISVQIQEQQADYYAPAHKFNLDTSKLERLGWRPYVDLIETYTHMMQYWNQDN